jgi:UDP-2,3-diacylglucosamine pyrophosphatase LpxH
MQVHRVKHAWVVSDLHVGAGGDDPLEDFHDDALFADWVDERAGARDRSTIVLNGDVVDFLQIDVPPAGDPLPDHYLWDEATSVAKLQRCAEGHPAVFEALHRFVVAGGSLLVTVGNHDLDLAWPGVQAELHSLVGAADDTIAFGLQHRLFDTVHVEHGHRFTPENRPRDFDSFVHDWAANGSAPQRVLECPWGSRFVLDEINPLERELPYLDNVKPILKVAYHLLMGDALEGRRFSTVLKLLRFVMRHGLPPKDVADMAIAAHDPLEHADGQAVHDAFAEGEHEWRSLIGHLRTADPGEVEEALAGLQPAEHMVLRSGERVRLDEPLLGVLRSSREERAARSCIEDQGAEYVVFGHTHDIVDGELDGRWFNPGSWIPHLDADDPDVANNGRPLLELAADPNAFVSDRRAVHLASTGDRVTITLEDV